MAIINYLQLNCYQKYVYVSTQEYWEWWHRYIRHSHYGQMCYERHQFDEYSSKWGYVLNISYDVFLVEVSKMFIAGHFWIGVSACIRDSLHIHNCYGLYFYTIAEKGYVENITRLKYIINMYDRRRKHQQYRNIKPKSPYHVNLANVGMRCASYRGDLDIIKNFIDIADANDFIGGLKCAIDGGHKDIAEFFLNKGIKKRDINWNDCMERAIDNNNLEMVKYCIEKGADNYIDGYDRAKELRKKRPEYDAIFQLLLNHEMYRFNMRFSIIFSTTFGIIIGFFIYLKYFKEN